MTNTWTTGACLQADRAGLTKEKYPLKVDRTKLLFVATAAGETWVANDVIIWMTTAKFFRHATSKMSHLGVKVIRLEALSFSSLLHSSR